jgi:hypothetical protein
MSDIFRHFSSEVFNTESTLPEFLSALDTSNKYKTTVTNILTKHYEEVRNRSDNIIQYASSKKKLKELVTKHNDEIFSFLKSEEKLPGVISNAETIFRKYGQDVPVLKGDTAKHIVRDLNLDVSLNTTVKEFDDGLKKINGTTLTDFIKQLRWIFTEYKTVGDEILALEINLYKKLESLDKLSEKLPLMMNLGQNEALPELMSAFTKYADTTFTNSHIDEDYKQLVQAYKKWNICRQIVALQSIVKAPIQEPTCSICLIEGVTHAIVPCGHTFCSICSKKQNTTCYICRGIIRERIKLYFT